MGSVGVGWGRNGSVGVGISVRGRKFGTDLGKRSGEGSEMLVFLGQKGTQNGVQNVENYGGSKILRIQGRYYFSTEGSFGFS